jgi:group I intron endonuclease
MKPLQLTPQKDIDSTKPGIYMIYCASSEKAYIGQTKHLQKRLYQHKWKLNKGTHPNPHLQNAYQKYGEAYFNFILLENCTQSELTVKEAEWLDKIDIELRYNINKVTDVHPVSEETRKKISDTRIGKKWSEEQKNRLSKSRKGVKKSEETKAKMKEAQKRRGERSFQ